MNSKIKIVRCPKCRRNHLSVFEDKEFEQNERKALSRYGDIGWIYSKVKQIHNLFWICNDCGCKFPMEETM